ncbi:uncharacterized protein LOC122036607 isoform X1 [Zingiber officinale]|uniref:uncharacterized protein LOC122036607 isoform X1 n=1 Tax=Zingiber officinale TaxID=94328 RepID=UPI001C4DB2AD|nr:uncharacterized protein LOC122036607 isoform X1 [Zingiber officinale]XP_042451923.1 uncharacterized protein LOC122036607 isoform X1 [Zingiber officinale]
MEELKLNAEYPRHEVIHIEAPNLLRLTLNPAPRKLQILCQKLKYLKLKPDLKLMHLHVEAPSLIFVRLYRIWSLEEFARTLFNVTAVTIVVSDTCLSGLLPKFLKQYEAVVEGFPIFHKLHKLEIKMFFAEKCSLNIVFGLLRCTPNLHSLVLTEYKKQAGGGDFDEWESSSRINEPLELLERVSVNIKSERIRSAFLKTLSQRVLVWDRVVVTY